MEEQLKSKELAGQSNAGELQLQLKKKDDIEKENLLLKTDKENLISASEKLQGQNEKLQNQIKEMQTQYEKTQAQMRKCRDSLNVCLKENRGYKQERR
jgi:chromosome segregation ATPase